MYTKKANLLEVEKKFKVEDFPLVVLVELSNYCNLKCTMCSHKDMKRAKGRMSMSLYKKVVDEIASENPYSRLWLAWSGEPLIEGYRLYYMIEYAKKRGIQQVCINTNGQLLSEDMADMLIDSGIDQVHIDIDGFSREVYEQIRVGGDRDRLYKNVEYFLTRIKERQVDKPVINLKVIEMDVNRAEVSQIIDYWKSYDVLFEVTEAHSWAGKVIDQVKDQRQRIACCYAIGHFEVSWDGRVPLCSPDTELTNELGNLKQQSIKEIWQCRREGIIKLQMEHRFSELPDLCQNCKDWMHVGTEMRSYSDGKLYKRSYESNEKY